MVILSIIGIVLFLLKKNSEVLELVEKEAGREIIENNQNSTSKNISINGKIKQRALIILEKNVKKIQVLFLKLENFFTSWGERLRKKRNARIESLSAKEEVTKKEKIDSIANKLEKYLPSKESIRGKLNLKQKTRQEEIEEKFFRPIISDKIVVPRRRRETKNRLEELLIERIAVNPKDIEAYERLGEYYLEIKNLKHSIECFKQVIRLNPTNANVKYKIKKLERMLGE
ncbi:MAG TPA: hypothetical protein DCS28_00685 [Candidatus Moranbacteria bacterium]|nr:hypothetical protein [Candidatus Moranbacteria bacterium]HAT74547.1 hypothetical protein [Candidatus Moranbacteria bacterium]